MAKKKESTNFVQIVDMTKEERIKMYLTRSKKTLAEMLAQRDEMDKIINDVHVVPQIVAPPTFKDICKTWDDCVNPHYDCINCPLHGTHNPNYVSYTSNTVGTGISLDQLKAKL